MIKWLKILIEKISNLFDDIEDILYIPIEWYFRYPMEEDEAPMRGYIDENGEIHFYYDYSLVGK